MSLKVYVYMWMKPGEDRVFVSAGSPPSYNVSALKKKGYCFFRLEAELPKEFEDADREIRAKTEPLENLIDTCKLRNVYKRTYAEEE